MQDLLLLSIVIATFLIPARAAREADARRGLRRTICRFVLASVAYLGALWILYPRIGS